MAPGPHLWAPQMKIGGSREPVKVVMSSHFAGVRCARRATEPMRIKHHEHSSLRSGDGKNRHPKAVGARIRGTDRAPHTERPRNGMGQEIYFWR